MRPHPNAKIDIHSATLFTRRRLADVPGDRGEPHMEVARCIGPQIVREKAPALFPSLEERPWKGTGGE
jgi:hypothetical protein